MEGEMTTDSTFREWAILELMGHRRLAGIVYEQAVGGASFIRIDIPTSAERDGKQDSWTTQIYSPQAIYCITPTTEAIARQVANNIRHEPVHQWELTPAVESEAPW